jgi:magnesium transporter
MLRVLIPSNGRLVEVTAAEGARLPPEAIWIDLFRPSRDEERLVQASLGIELPSREEMREIEPSSRLYQESGALFMTANVLHKADTDDAESTPVTFILTGEQLVTIRYAEPRSFTAFAQHAERHPAQHQSGAAVLIGLLDAIVDRTADILEQVGDDTDRLSKDVFARSAPAKRKSSGDFEEILKRLGRDQDLTSRARDSLVSLSRLVSFLTLRNEPRSSKDLKARTRTLGRDVRSLTDHASFVSAKISFLLDASLGMINIEQNAIIKIFSVAAVVFLPPTLVASIYGMNFKFMPELEWPLGYPFALLLMILSAALPYWYFKRRGWL